MPRLTLHSRANLPSDGRSARSPIRPLQESTGSSLHHPTTRFVSSLLNLAVPIFQDKVFAGLETLYTSERRTLARNETSGYFVANFTLLIKNLREGLEVSASVRNLLDKTYSDPGSGEQIQDEIEQDGRSFWLKLKYRY